jgi:hypothetical protein
MHPQRLVRTSVSLVMLGLVSSLHGCSGQGSAPPDKETGKKIVGDMKEVVRELKEERAEANKDRPNMKAMMKARGRAKGGG